MSLVERTLGKADALLTISTVAVAVAVTMARSWWVFPIPQRRHLRAALHRGSAILQLHDLQIALEAFFTALVYTSISHGVCHHSLVPASFLSDSLFCCPLACRYT